MNTEWTNKQIDAELVALQNTVGKGLSYSTVRLLIRRMRDELAAELHDARRLLAACEDNRGQLVLALQEVTVERDQLRNEYITIPRDEMLAAVQADIAEMQTVSSTERIACPMCDHIQMASITHCVGHPWPILVHTCVKCGYTITESEWNTVKD